jgi:hypothetical protein
MKTGSERGRTDQDPGQTRRVALAKVDHDAVDPSHLASVPVDNRFIENISDDVHITLEQLRTE